MMRRSTSSKGDMERILIVGLGNPGKQYARTRHNVGTDVIELLAKRLNTKLKAGRDRSLIGEARIASHAVVLSVPTTYMNESGEAVGPLMRRFKITDPTQLIIIHDELDLAPGVVRIKEGGGLAGHNGLRSISEVIKTDAYVRVRIGVGKPPSKEAGADHVLSSIPSAERKILDVSIAIAADVVERIVSADLSTAMQEYNGR